jgi:glycosyltransferase involved in cell wall biosynthesis
MVNNCIGFSIVIPCLNEEKYIGILLETLVRQSFDDFEVIVVDGKSEDKTLEVVESYSDKLNLQILSSERGVSRQRNYGANHAKFDHILFLDADSKLDHQYLSDFASELKDSNADIATAYIWPDSRSPMDWFFWMHANVLTDLTRYVWPLGYGMNLYISKKLFIAINGFDENIKVAEDVDFVKRAVSSGGNYAVFKKPKYFTSVRRLAKEGHLPFFFKTMLIAWQAYRRGSFSKVDVSYEMGHWDKDLGKEPRSLWEQFKSVMLFWK